MLHTPILASLTAAFVALSACAGTGPVAQGGINPSYQGIQTVLLQDDMVSFRVALQGARGNDDVEAYGRCAAAQYALIRGYGFARHVRTTVAQSGEIWRGDAVYLISAALPPGLKTIDAEVAVRDCGALGIPTI
ncbi:hypothetical protein EYC08_11915 [Tabrizicola sp. WMC-M-20]|nr:hypothetical protein EYC08_11915 [Tabrizicola sp. WMC-M-20]